VQITGNPVAVGALRQVTASVSCPDGDAAIAGGFELVSQNGPVLIAHQVLSSYPSGSSWVMTVSNMGFPGAVHFRIHVTCADVQ
jgi:hypothetical protein